jgi:hypothetical protein
LRRGDGALIFSEKRARLRAAAAVQANKSAIL